MNSPAQVLRDAAELLDLLKPADVDVPHIIGLTARQLTANGREARDLGEDAMRLLARHLLYPADRDPVRYLAVWSATRSRVDIATVLRHAAEQPNPTTEEHA
jgi:hypothetical protein